ncbi:hypothetical protein FB565_005538 [Actinoplanes lutulentus]|uniref:Uncharacterized protein DUF3263 n=1 Tax=Actinoplanes lutulentus TaxID=1287878 RepID=A0A327ZD36_9ACTN|nr:DUF3263 domain-containing protein [Actinoplanes lutulentus]MBB2945780.1 hypothetical protein [Actinoplanes lutulentus]RAK37829.1 uncharacterized protein DUF3263 [Actinoplanes lutulentus]
MQPAAEPTGDQPVEEQQHIPAPRESPEPAATEPVTPETPKLTEREQQIIAFETKWWKHAGAKEQAIRDTFDLSSTRYYQLLNGLLDNPAALEHDPVLIGRLRRLRSARARTRRR